MVNPQMSMPTTQMNQIDPLEDSAAMVPIIPNAAVPRHKSIIALSIVIFPIL
jgi:hypothetical protein